MSMPYTPTIGLEIHAELKTKSKMFCDSKNDSLETRPNVNVCPICMGHPGTLPVANREAIRKVLTIGLALDCKIPEVSKFDRKNYFYPDLPKGYQISQYDMPLCETGELSVLKKKIRITRVHLEEDTARLVHPEKMNHSLVDFNRAGVPLMELVTEPDITTAKEASAFARELQTILRYLGVSDADMEKGQMRVEANVSIKPEGVKELGTKVEVKNLNSFRAVEQAIEYEAKRQAEVLDSGASVAQETRGWDDAKGETVSQREKEEAHDYRYFPEPDLPPFRFSKKEIEAMRKELPELPQERKKRFLKEYKLSEKEAEILIQNKEQGERFEDAIKEGGDVKVLSNYILNNERRDEILSKVKPAYLSEFSVWVRGGVSSTIAKLVLEETIDTGKSPSEIVKEKGIKEITDVNKIEEVAKEVIRLNPGAVKDFKAGKGNALQFLVGQLMAKTKGTANPEAASKILQKLLTR